MRLGGWLRLWIVLTALWGVAVALLAYDSRPRAEQVRNAWVTDGLELVRQRINEKEGSDIKPWQIAKHHDFDTAEKAIAYFERVEANPTMSQQLFSIELAEVNARHRDRISKIKLGWPTYALKAFAAWLIPALVILAFGYAVGWVRGGFRSETGRTNKELIR